MAKIAFKFRQETIEKVKHLLPNEHQLHELLESNNPGALNCLMDINNKLIDLMHEVNISTVEG